MKGARFAGLAALLMSSAAMTQDVIPVQDLGTKRVGESQNFSLTAQNLNCPTPQDFEFQLDNMPWLTADGPLIVRSLGPGQSKSIPARLDFTYTPPGTYYGRVTARCITCGWYVFSSCNENGQDVVLKITVEDPANPSAQTSPGSNPYAGMTPRPQIRVALTPPISDANVKELKNDDRKELNKARAGLRQAEARGQAAQTALADAQRAKSDCERKLAQLKAEAAAAQKAADLAKTQKESAERAAKAADRELDGYRKDVREALKEVDSTMRAVQVAVRYRNSVEEEDGTSTGRYQRAQEQVDRFQAEHFAALRAHTAVSKSQSERRDKASQAEAAAEAAKKKAKETAEAARTAHQKVKDQIKICGGQADEVVNAQDNLDKARSSAADAVHNANKAEAKAAKQALERLEDRIKQHKQKCERAEENAKADMAKWAQAIEAGQKLKMLDEDGGRAASALKAINDKIWGEARKLAEDKIPTPDSLGSTGFTRFTDADKAALTRADSAEDMLGKVTGLMGWAVDGLSGTVGGVGVPDFGQAQMLGGMKALGLGLQNIVNAIRNPNTYAAQRNRQAAKLLGKDNYLVQQMKSKGIGKNTKEREEILNRIDQLHNNRNLIAERTQRYATQAARCAAELRKLEAQRDALRQRVSGK